MVSDSIINLVCESVLVESCEDYVGLWSIVWEFRETHQEKDSSEIYQGTLQVIESLLKSKLIQSGLFKNGEFEVWNSTPADVLTRIKNEWKEKDREPTIGEIVWFQATEKGKEVARSPFPINHLLHNP